MQTLLKAIRTGGSGEAVELKASRDGDLRVNQYLPPYAMLAASGQLFAFDVSGAVGKQPDTAVPTTSPEWSIYNANPAGGKHISLIHVSATCASGTTGLGFAILACVGIGAQTAQTGSYTNAIISCLDGTAKLPNAYIANNVAIINTQPAWTAIFTEDKVASVSVGSGGVASPLGMFIAPPKDSIFIAVYAAAGITALYDIHIVVAEMYLDT